MVEAKQILRISVGAERTEHRHVEGQWAALDTAARR